jgi:hypothetical protein
MCAFAKLAVLMIPVAIRCSPAVWNGFPLLFDDVGGYLYPWWSGSLSNGRSIPYGGLLWLTMPMFWVPAILLQATVTLWTLDLLLRVFGETSRYVLILVAAGSAATSGLAFFVSQIMPDCWAAPAVIALHLIGWHRTDLSKLECVGLTAIIVFAAMSHTATLIVLSGLVLVYIATWFWQFRLGVAPNGVGLTLAAMLSGLLLLPIANAAVTGRFAFIPGGDVFLFERMVETGLIGKVLAAECPRGIGGSAMSRAICLLMPTISFGIQTARSLDLEDGTLRVLRVRWGVSSHDLC